MTICRPNAVRPMCLSEGSVCFRIFWVSVSEHLVGIGAVPNWLWRSECLNSQWKEVGREEREEKEGKLQEKGEMNGNNNWMTEPWPIHIRNLKSKMLHHGDEAFFSTDCELSYRFSWPRVQPHIKILLIIKAGEKAIVSISLSFVQNFSLLCIPLGTAPWPVTKPGSKNKQQSSNNTNWLKELQCVCLSTLAVQNILQPVQQAQTGR